MRQLTQDYPAPLLTMADPMASSEGTLDPLGLYAIADTLALRLVPGVRERQKHPRFLTAVAVSLAVTGDFEPDTVAKDGISEPWQVFEWYLVEGLVRTAGAPEEIGGLPGSQKANNALRDRVPLSARRYLKTPTVFGFHGVYRGLARNLGVDGGDRLGETGYELLRVWAEEQGLSGFYGTLDGPGRYRRTQLLDAVRDGLEQGAVARSGGWNGWEFFKAHLAPHSAGRREASFIRDRLLEEPTGLRGEVLRFLVSLPGRAQWERDPSERAFHEVLIKQGTPELRQVLRSIDAYEHFCRLVQSAFEDCLYEMSMRKGRKVSPAVLGELAGVKRAARKAPDRYAIALEALSSLNESYRFQPVFEALGENGSASGWVQRLLEHHRTNQLRKPPNGKNPWFERYDDGSVMIRPGYLRDEPGDPSDGYVHAYRTNSLWTFAQDLGLL